MSEMEHNKGKLIPFKMTEEVAKTLVEAKGESLDSDSYESYKEQVGDDYTWYDESLVRIGSEYYTVEFEVECGELYDFAEASRNPDGTIDFNTYHYNSCHWTEVVEHALKEGSK